MVSACRHVTNSTGPGTRLALAQQSEFVGRSRPSNPRIQSKVQSNIQPHFHEQNAFTPHSMGPRIVLLNVGGRTFATAHQTLVQQDGSLLAELVTEPHSAVASYLEGALFIDRNPKYFELLLDWLRDKNGPLPADVETQEALTREAAFYRLPELAAALRRTPQQNPRVTSQANAGKDDCCPELGRDEPCPQQI